MAFKILISAALAAGLMQAEFLRIEVSITDMNCASCTETLVGSFKRMRGVERVEADSQAWTVRLDLAAGNRIGVEQAWDAIKRVGFTPGETRVTVRGVMKAGKLEVPETGKIFDIEGSPPVGEDVEINGAITPPPDPRTPVKIRLTK